MKEEKRFFTVSEVARICSTSRSALLRMEQDGILTPAYINEENGYRYYDQHGILRAMRNLSFKDVGMTHKELSDYYNNDNYEIMYANLSNKLEKLQSIVDVLKMELQHENHLNTEYSSFPEVYCYTKTLKDVTDTSMVRPFLWKVTSEAISEGAVLSRNIHPFVTIDINKVINEDYSGGHDYTINIPIIPSKNMDFKDRVVHYEATGTISSYLYGGSSDIKECFEKMGKEVREKGLDIVFQARIMSIVISLPGESIPEEYWVSKVSIPIKGR